MERTHLKILLVDDRQLDSDFVLLALRKGGIDSESRRVDNAPDFENALSEDTWDVILCDHLMPDFDAIRALKILKRLAIDTPCIIVSGGANEEAVVEMLRLGAQDLVPKDKLPRLAPMVFRAISESRERLQRRNAELALARSMLSINRLRRFFPPQIAESILSGEVADPFRWRKAEVIVLYIDLRGFTQFAESGAAERVMRTLQMYYAEVARIAQRHDGTIGHIAGDGIMMIFNDPVKLEHPLNQATEAALALREALTPICLGVEDSELSFGIGIADGVATIGGIGEAGCWDYTVVGSVANLAARLCAKAQNGQILVSTPFVAGAIGAFHFEKLGTTDFKGMRDKVDYYDVVEKL